MQINPKIINSVLSLL